MEVGAGEGSSLSEVVRRRGWMRTKRPRHGNQVDVRQHADLKVIAQKTLSLKKFATLIAQVFYYFLVGHFVQARTKSKQSISNLCPPKFHFILIIRHFLWLLDQFWCYFFRDFEPGAVFCLLCL